MEVKYTVKFSNSMEDMSETSYQMPEQNSFDSMKEAMDFVATEAEKAKTLLLELPDAGCYRFYHGPASQSIRKEPCGSCHWEIVETDKNERRAIMMTFYPDKYVQETYGITEDVYSVPEERDIPYVGLQFALSIEGKFESCWGRDKGLPFEVSLAKKLIDDPNVRVGTRFYYVKRDGEYKSATSYFLPCKNPDSVIFKPTVHQPVSNACNISTKFIVEALFAFGDGYLVPVTKHFNTEGSFSISVRDAMDAILDEVDGSYEEVEHFFEGCGNYKKSDCGFILCGYSASGQECAMDFDTLNYREIKRALVSVRLVNLMEWPL